MTEGFNAVYWPGGIVIARKAFSADEAIFLARIASRKDYFVVPPRNDDFSSYLSMVAESKDLYRKIDVEKFSKKNLLSISHP